MERQLEGKRDDEAVSAGGNSSRSQTLTDDNLTSSFGSEDDQRSTSSKQSIIEADPTSLVRHDSGIQKVLDNVPRVLPPLLQQQQQPPSLTDVKPASHRSSTDKDTTIPGRQEKTAFQDDPAAAAKSQTLGKVDTKEEIKGEQVGRENARLAPSQLQPRDSSSVPGAYAFSTPLRSSDPNDSSHSLDLLDVEQPPLPGGETNPEELLPPDDPQSTLPVANTVSLSDLNSSANQIQGVAVEVGTNEISQKEKGKGCKLPLVFVGIILLMVIIIVTVLAIVLPKNRSADSEEPMATNQTSPPIPMEEYVQSLLPNYTVSELSDPGSAQSLAYQWLIEDPSLSDYPDWRIQQRLALATFYHATGGPQSWLNRTHWLSYVHHECSWHSSGILWDVGSVAFTSSNLNTDMLARYFGMGICNDQRAYQQLRLYFNNIQGTIPKEIALLTSLKTLIAFGKLEGTLPTEIAHLQQLEALALIGNRLTGRLPSEMGLLSSLKGAGLLNNRFQGQIPSELGLMANVEELHMGENQFSGTIPTELGNLQKANKLLLTNNRLTGSIPSELGLMASLTDLRVPSNLLSGQIPSELGLLRGLTHLDVAENDLWGPAVPQELILGGLSLSHLSLSENPLLSGTIPTEFCSGNDIEVVFSCSALLCGCDCPCAP